MFWKDLSTSTLFFFPLWARAFAFFQFCPLFSTPYVPVRMRATLALLIAWWFTPILQSRGIYTNLEFSLWILYVLGEVLLGLIQAFIILAFYNTLQIASYFFSFQMGLTMAQISDPSTDLETPIVGQLLVLLAIWMFLSNNYIFYIFWIGISESIQKVNVLTLIQLQDLKFRDFVIGIISDIFSKSFLLSLPIIGLLFVVNFLTGLLSKAAPQINLLVLIFPVCIALGLYILFIAFPSLFLTFSVIMEHAFSQLRGFLALLLLRGDI